MNESLKEKLRYLRLNRLATHWEADLKEAARQRMSHATFLTHVIEEEHRIKCDNARQQRLKRAHIPESWTMATYPFARQPKLNRKQVMALYDTMDFIPKAQNIIWLGRTGCGKTGLATSFLIRAIEQGYTGLFVSFAQLITELFRSLADRSEARALKPYLSCDILHIDELGYIETEPAQVGLFFTLMQRRHKRKPTLVTSNLGFADWGSFLKNDHLTDALIDRLTESSHIINMKECVSLRGKLSPE